LANKVPGYNKPAKYEWLSNEDGKNYREITLQHPIGQVEKPGTRMITYKYDKFSESKPFPVSFEDLEKMKAKGFIIEDHGPGMANGPAFNESHHDEPNTIGHIRVSDFRDPDNKKVLYVHEVQSDWGQKGRKAGFNPETMPAAPYVANREGSHNTPGWTDLLVKRIMQEAQRGKYDKVVFETVDEQIKRSGTSSAKGMTEFYGNILPKRLAKVMKHADPEFQLTEHVVSKSKTKPIAFGKEDIRQGLSELDSKIFPSAEDYDPEVSHLNKYYRSADPMGATSYEDQLKMSGVYDDYVLHQAKKQGVEPPRITVGKVGDVFSVVDESTGEQVGSFGSRKEALAALKTYSADKVMEMIKSGEKNDVRPGFDVSKAVKHVGKNTRAYKYGGDVESALDIARKVGR
jgi:hypothetical protein